MSQSHAAWIETIDAIRTMVLTARSHLEDDNETMQAAALLREAELEACRLTLDLRRAGLGQEPMTITYT